MREKAFQRGAVQRERSRRLHMVYGTRERVA